MRTSAILAALLVAGCAQPQWQEFTARYTAYRFPSELVASANSSPHRFIRLSPKGEPFELVYDSRIDINVDRRGHPQLFSINATPLARVTYTPARSGMVACRTSLTAAQCGIAVTVGGDRWSVLFPASQKAQADAFASRAADFLSSHTRPLH